MMKSMRRRVARMPSSPHAFLGNSTIHSHGKPPGMQNVISTDGELDTQKVHPCAYIRQLGNGGGES